MNLWSRIQVVKVHYQTGALSKSQFVHVLGEFFKEATKLRGKHNAYPARTHT